MTNVVVGKSGLRRVTWEATVLGPCAHCGTGAEQWDATACVADEHEPTFTRPLGVISRWHRNPIVRAWWAVTDTLKKGR